MTILLTRPQEDSVHILQRLQDEECAVMHAPMMRIVPVTIADTQKAIMLDAQKAGFARLVFSSANGVRALVKQMPEMVSAPCYCVGAQTAQCARELGFGAVFASGGDVEKLQADILHNTVDDYNGMWFHVRGADHRGALVRALIQKQYNAHAICAYNAEHILALAQDVVDAIFARKIRSVLLYSPRTAKLFELALQQKNLLDCCKTMTAYGLSAAVLAELQADWGAVWSPPQPDAQLLLAKVISATA